MNKFQIVTVRDGPTRVDWAKRVLTIRKPRTAGPKTPELPYMQLKRDGLRVTCAADRFQLPSVFTTQGIDLSYAHKLDGCAWYQRLRTYLGELHVDAELHVPGKGREAVKTVLVNDPNSLELAVFGCGHVRPDAQLWDLDYWCEMHGLEALPWCVAKDSENFLLRYDSDPQYDGVCYKDTMYGKWFKEKHVRTIDCIVTKINLGIGKHWGKCGSLGVSVYAEGKFGQPILREIANVSGMDDDTRAAIHVNSTLDLGRVVEVAYERVGSGGRLQHPRFIDWRDDKAPEDCTVDQDSMLGGLI